MKTEVRACQRSEGEQVDRLTGRMERFMKVEGRRSKGGAGRNGTFWQNPQPADTFSRCEAVVSSLRARDRTALLSADLFGKNTPRVVALSSFFFETRSGEECFFF